MTQKKRTKSRKKSFKSAMMELIKRIFFVWILDWLSDIPSRVVDFIDQWT
ncbi:hypothetical protein C8N37_10692 [Sphingobacterium faecium]|nr:hypothetical protein C8N37_10692 [Sphingobacterium faecium]